MLKSVHLKNLALIKEAQIDFTKGLNIMTGETGSGKSVIIGSVNIALGDKANKAMIRTGSDFALAELEFSDVCPQALALLDELDIDKNGGNIIVSRKITPDSSAARINGETTTLSNLKRLTSLLVDVHGQHEHQSLLDPAKHMEILDDFAGDDVSKIKKDLSDELSEYKKLRSEYKIYDKDEAQLEREISLLKYEVQEIEKAALAAGEDLKLEESFKQMSLREKTSESLEKIRYIFADESSGLVRAVSEALREMDEAVKYDPSLASFKSTLSDIDSLSKDFSHDISKYTDENSFDRAKFREITDRLNLINRLKSKYGSSVPEILEYEEKAQKQIGEYENYEGSKAALSEKLSRSKAKINALAKELSAQRKKAAGKLELLIADNLKDLNFLSAEFKIDFSLAQKISKDGFDRVQFMVSLNPGQPLKPLAVVASGGELSRIMLAVKSAIAENDQIETLIFDEIDTGISGQTAFKVSEKLKSLSSDHQIICITHLPQIASGADSHFLIEKEVADGAAISGIRKLSDEGSAYELAKMISANEVTPAALEHAKELKRRSRDLR